MPRCYFRPRAGEDGYALARLLRSEQRAALAVYTATIDLTLVIHEMTNSSIMNLSNQHFNILQARTAMRSCGCRAASSGRCWQCAPPPSARSVTRSTPTARSAPPALRGTWAAAPQCVVWR